MDGFSIYAVFAGAIMFASPNWKWTGAVVWALAMVAILI